MELTYTFFRDLNSNNDSDLGEGIPSVMVNLTSEDSLGYNLISDSNGELSTYLRSNKEWDILAQAEGYFNHTEVISLESISRDYEAEMYTEEVSIGGRITYIDDIQFSLIADEVIL